MSSPHSNGVRTVILAGGKGTRLRPLTAVFPKPLVPLGNKPVLEILLRRLASSGLTDVTICTGYLGELIQAVCGNGTKFGLRIEYVSEEQPLGTAGPLSLIPNLTDPVMVVNGDLLTTLDFRRMIQFHRANEADVTLGLFPREVKIDFGVIELGSDGEFNGYREKPTYHFEVSMGVNIIGSAAVKHVEKGKHLDMPDLILKVHQNGGKVKCYRQPCRWLDIGRMDDYAQAQDEFSQNEAAFLENRAMTVQEDMIVPRQANLDQTRKPISVCLLISSLEFGGAERQVVEMVRSFDRNKVNPFVCSLSREVPLAHSLPGNGGELSIVEKRGRFDFTTVFRVARLLRRRRVDVIHAFLFDAEIVARLAAPLARAPVVVSSERNTDYVRSRLHKIALKATQPLFDVMVANSFAGKRFNMRTLGLADSRIEVVHNGVDVERFCPDRAAGLAFRERLGISAAAPLIGMVGSFKRQKGHDCFLRMAGRVADSFPQARFLIVGEPVSDDFEETSLCQAEAKALAAALNIADRCVFLGNQRDMKAVYNACDLTALLSRREGTPNVVLESMACGVPVIATDIADNSIIILNGKTGCVVPQEDSSAAAACALELLRDRERLIRMGEAARERACLQFSLRVAAARLENIYAGTLRRKCAAAASAAEAGDRFAKSHAARVGDSQQLAGALSRDQTKS